MNFKKGITRGSSRVGMDKKLQDLPNQEIFWDFTNSIFRGVLGVGARLPWAEE